MAKLTVHALDAGHITLPERFFISPSDSNASQSVPSMSFLIQHVSQKTGTTRLLFDLGLRRDVSLYPSPLQTHCARRSPISTKPDVVESLNAGGLTVDDIDYVILSHVHYDHVGYPKDFTNPKTKFIVGSGASDLLSGSIKLHGLHSTFEPDLLPSDRTIELSLPQQTSDSSKAEGLHQQSNEPTVGAAAKTMFKKSLEDCILNLERWTSFDRLPCVLDVFGDASVYIVWAPGHLPGHINLLARTSLVPPRYVLLAGDACHDIRLLNGTHDIGTWTDEEGTTCCIHNDKETAKKTIQKLREIRQHGLTVETNTEQGEEGDMTTDPPTNQNPTIKAEVEVIFAHNWAWEQESKKTGRFFPGHL